jgi:hypothetical protein
MAARKTVAGVLYFRFNPIATFFYGNIRKTNGRKLRQSCRCINLYGNKVEFHADNTHTRDFNKHSKYSMGLFLEKYSLVSCAVSFFLKLFKYALALLLILQKAMMA